MPSNPKAEPYLGQQYRKIKSQCVKKKGLFVDTSFPASGNSIFHTRAAPADIIWKRPKDIVSDPKFFIDKASADDFAQGTLGNCWFVAACACIAEDSNLWKKVVPDYHGQEWSTDNKYAGIFHFRFWRCGKWVDVVIDDQLPTRGGRLIFLHSKSRNEFWSALLEKAYAKLFGSYEALTAGKSRDAMVDLTGGAGETLDIIDFRGEERKTRLFDILHKAKINHSLMCASIQAKSAAEMETKLSIGLVRGHAYSITAVQKIHLKGTGLFQFFNREKILMIRCRNPWGGVEWRGPWSDGSPEWTKVSESEKKELGLTFDENGEFWMSFDDFCRYFTTIDLCHIVNTSFFTLKKTYSKTVFTGEWKRPHRAGGCGNHPTFLKNPQYLLEVFDNEKEEIMISLEQKDRRSASFNKRGENYCIGYAIVKTDLNRKYRMHDRLERVHAGPYVVSRSIFDRVHLAKGRYCMLVTTFDPGNESNYMLRVYSEGAIGIKELVNDEPKPPGCMGKPKVAATSVTIHYADGLKDIDKEGIEAYCIVKCEGKEVKTTVSSKTNNPQWKERVTFYRKQPEEDIEIELWDDNMLKDSYIGAMTIPMSKKSDYTSGHIIRRYDIRKNVEDRDTVTGYLWLNIRHTENVADA
ncbi:hypothetical protein SNE40_001159 [Patella caerulea]|uniref:Calpain-5 n=1 Tax=Patella caerulea TaxID=87958 RepID=A0AAN8KBY0_PATCE